MNSEQLIGNRWVRAAAAILTLGLAGAVVLRSAGVWPEWHRSMGLASWACGFLGLLAGVHWSQRTYRNWMTAAGAINLVTTTVLMGGCYLLIVPVFWGIVQLRRLAGSREHGSNWHEIRPVDRDLRYFQRMG